MSGTENVNGFSLVTQVWPRPDTPPYCLGHAGPGLVLSRATRVVVAADAGRRDERDQLVAALRAQFDAAGAGGLPCGGPGAELSCKATYEPAARNLLLFLADDVAAPSHAAASFAREWIEVGFEAAGVMPLGAPSATVLPTAIEHLNALSWQHDIREVLEPLLDLLLVDDEDQRVFVSYARSDGRPTAERIFDLLTRAGFDVFLDRFSLAPGQSFVARIREEIVDKAMVVVVESAAAARSDWVKQEIAIAAGLELGLAAVNLDSSPVFPQIVPRHRVDSHLPATAQHDATLLAFLLSEHRTQLLHRREHLHAAVEQALIDHGRQQGLRSDQIRARPRGFSVDASGGRRVLDIAVRPADLARFRAVHESAAGDDAYLFHPPPAATGRKRDLAWLSDRSGVSEVDLGRVHAAVRRIVT